MIKFIKKLFKTKINEDAINEEVNSEYRSHNILDHILLLCSSVQPNQEHCSPLLIYDFVQLLSLNIQEDIEYAMNLFNIYLTEPLQYDLINKVIQSKEYKEYKTRKRIEELSKDFN